jgi:hypothetical protein
VACAEFWNEQENFEDPTTLLSNLIARSGNVDVMLWARNDERFAWDTLTSSTAAKFVHVELLKYLYENGCPGDKESCNVAAEHRCLDVLVYAHENGCPWDTDTCAGAAKEGHLEVLQYARANDCPWDSWTFSSAALGGQMG